MKRETYPEKFETRGIRKQYFGVRNQMVRAWNLIWRLRSVHGIDIPDETWRELESNLSFDASDRIFMSAVFHVQEAEQIAFDELRSIVAKATAMGGAVDARFLADKVASIEKLVKDTDDKIRCEVPAWILERLKR